jgi:hypothetical protein
MLPSGGLLAVGAGSYLPTPTHHFLHLLHRKGLLLRVFTQNIDGLEQQAGLPADMVVPAHGSFDGECCPNEQDGACYTGSSSVGAPLCVKHKGAGAYEGGHSIWQCCRLPNDQRLVHNLLFR